MSRIRVATLHDVGPIVEMGRSLKLESPVFEDVTYDPKLAANFLIKCVEQPGRCLFVDDDHNGFLAGGVGSYFFSPDHYAEDYTLYVKPESRGGRLGIGLIQAFEHWAKGLGVGKVFIGSNVGINMLGFESFMQRLGYVRTGLSMSKDIG